MIPKFISNSKLPPSYIVQLWIKILALIIFTLYILLFYLHYESRKKFWIYNQDFSLGRIVSYLKGTSEPLPARVPLYKFINVKSFDSLHMNFKFKSLENGLVYINIINTFNNQKIYKTSCPILMGDTFCSFSNKLPSNLLNTVLAIEIVSINKISILSSSFLIGNESINVTILSGNRTGLWFGDPNLAGHSFAAMILLILLFNINLNQKWLNLVILLGCFDLYITGSRTAGLSLMLGMLCFLWLALRQLYWFRISSFVIFVVVVGGLLFYPGMFGRFSSLDQSDITRASIWNVAVDSIRKNPFSGISASDFALNYEKTYPLNKGSTARHAHNFWLQMGVRFGVIGLIGALVVTFSMIGFAWYFGSWRGIVFVVPFFLMNFFDYSLNYIGVWTPLLIGLWYLKSYKM